MYSGFFRVDFCGSWKFRGNFRVDLTPQQYRKIECEGKLSARKKQCSEI